MAARMTKVHALGGKIFPFVVKFSLFHLYATACGNLIRRITRRSLTVPRQSAAINTRIIFFTIPWYRKGILHTLICTGLIHRISVKEVDRSKPPKKQ
jgi:hypothetical protein